MANIMKWSHNYTIYIKSDVKYFLISPDKIAVEDKMKF